VTSSTWQTQLDKTCQHNMSNYHISTSVGPSVRIYKHLQTKCSVSCRTCPGADSVSAKFTTCVSIIRFVCIYNPDWTCEHDKWMSCRPVGYFVYVPSAYQSLNYRRLPTRAGTTWPSTGHNLGISAKISGASSMCGVKTGQQPGPCQSPVALI